MIADSPQSQEQSPGASGLRDGLPPGWDDIVRFCPACGSAKDLRSLACGYRDAAEQVVYWWCHFCGFEALLTSIHTMVADVVDTVPQGGEAS